MIKKVENLRFSIDPNKIALNQRKFEGSEIGRGIGIHKAKKGKGSFTRKEKHKRSYSKDNYGSFFILGNIYSLEENYHV